MSNAIEIAKKKGLNYMSLGEFQKFAAMAGIPCKNIIIFFYINNFFFLAEELFGATKFLGDAGVLINFEDDDSLRDVVVLNCQWLASIMSDIISFRTNFLNGVAYFSTIQKIWKDYPVEIQGKLIKLLEKFEIIYTIRKETEILKVVIPR